MAMLLNVCRVLLTLVAQKAMSGLLLFSILFWPRQALADVAAASNGCTLWEGFSYVTDEEKRNDDTFGMIFEYRLDIFMITNANVTDCNIVVEDSGGEIIDYVDLNHGEKCRNHRCFDEWCMTNKSEILRELRFITTNNSVLPKEGKYQLRLNNGKYVFHRGRPRAIRMKISPKNRNLLPNFNACRF